MFNAVLACSSANSKFHIAFFNDSSVHFLHSSYGTWNDMNLFRDISMILKGLVKIILIIAQTSIETVPKEIAKHNSVLNDSLRKGIKPTELLLDRSIHHRAMLNLKNNEKRGRPDILYHILLDVTSSPIYRFGYLELYIHTVQNYVMKIANGLRPPRSYNRFERLMVQLFKEGVVGDNLIELTRTSFSELVRHLQTDKVIGFSRKGEFKKIQYIIDNAIRFKKPTFVIGGFPKGYFDEEIASCFDNVYSISRLPLDSSTSVNRLLCGLEENENFFSAMYNG